MYLLNNNFYSPVENEDIGLNNLKIREELKKYAS